jgi:hypothetical protein
VTLIVASLAVGIVLGVATLRSIDTGESWRDWQNVDVPTWFNVLQIVLVVSLLGGFIAWFLAAEVRAVLIFVPFGFCTVAFATGLRRWLVRRRTAQWQPVEHDEPELPPRPPFWKRLGMAVLIGAPISVGLGYLVLDLRETEELLMLAILGPFSVYVHDATVDRSTRWRWRNR